MDIQHTVYEHTIFIFSVGEYLSCSQIFTLQIILLRAFLYMPTCMHRVAFPQGLYLRVSLSDKSMTMFNFSKNLQSVFQSGGTHLYSHISVKAFHFPTSLPTPNTIRHVHLCCFDECEILSHGF